MAPAGALGRSASGRDLAAASLRAAQAGDSATGAVVGMLQYDADGLNAAAQKLKDTDDDNAGLLGHLRHAVTDLF